MPKSHQSHQYFLTPTIGWLVCSPAAEPPGQTQSSMLARDWCSLCILLSLQTVNSSPVKKDAKLSPDAGGQPHLPSLSYLSYPIRWQPSPSPRQGSSLGLDIWPPSPSWSPSATWSPSPSWSPSPTWSPRLISHDLPSRRSLRLPRSPGADAYQPSTQWHPDKRRQRQGCYKRYDRRSRTWRKRACHYRSRYWANKTFQSCKFETDHTII